jgi:hypothetical protein
VAASVTFEGVERIDAALDLEPLDPDRVEVRPFVSGSGCGWAVHIDGRCVMLSYSRGLAYGYRDLLVNDGERP